MRYDYSFISWVAANNNMEYDKKISKLLTITMSFKIEPYKKIFEQYTEDQSRGLVFVSGGRSFPATDMKVTVPTGACWCLVALSLPFFQITRPRMPLRLSRRIDHSCCVWTLG